MDLELRTPLVAEDGGANGAILLLHIRVIDFSLEEHFWRLKWVLGRDTQLELEDTWKWEKKRRK